MGTSCVGWVGDGRPQWLCREINSSFWLISSNNGPAPICRWTDGSHVVEGTKKETSNGATLVRFQRTMCVCWLHSIASGECDVGGVPLKASGYLGEKFSRNLRGRSENSPVNSRDTVESKGRADNVARVNGVGGLLGSVYSRSLSLSPYSLPPTL